MRHLLLLFALCTPFASPSAGALHTTPGAIARLDAPAGFVAQYDANADASLLSQGMTDQILVLAGPALPPREGMMQLLQAFGVSHYAPQVQNATLTGHDGVRLDAKTNVYERWYVLAFEGASLVVRAASTSSFESLHDATVSVVESIQLAPVTHPRLVAGSYETGVYRSGMGDYGASDGLSVYAESGVRLLPDGSLRDSSFAGGSGAPGTVMSESSGRGRWEVRGDRLLMVYGDGTVGSFRVKAFSNGLELWNQQGHKLLWVRK